MPPNQLIIHRSPYTRRYEAASNLFCQYARGKSRTSGQHCSLAGPRACSAHIHTSIPDRPTTFTTEPNIDIKSLENTLRAHREANREPVVRKIYKKGESVWIKDRDGGLPALKVKVPRKDIGLFKRVDLSPITALRGTNRDLDALWRIKDTEKNPPLQYRLPWLRHLDSTDSRAPSAAIERLTAEIRAFEKYSSPSEEEQRAASDALNDIIDCIKDIDAGLIVDVIGSRATNLADPLSDLDINVASPEQCVILDNPAQEAPFRVLKKLYRALQKPSKNNNQSDSRRIETHYYLKQARVPILLCRHKPTGLPIQIQSTPRTYDSREYVKASLREYPSLKGLFKVLKQLLQMRGLTIGSAGGITSYPLLQMIVATLKFSEARFHPADLGGQFLLFLDFYSDIDFSTHGISTEPLELFSKSVGRGPDCDEEADDASDGLETPPQSHITFKGRTRRRSPKSMSHLMTLQDPANPINDLGKSCFHIKDVQETFIALRTTLKRAMAEWDAPSKAPTRSGGQSVARSLLEPCVGGDYTIYEHERDDLRRLGRRSLQKLEEATAS
ncbi:DNA polymerase sigma subunit [Cladophialophora carrionii]|uniref:DNA polymerase sigma subunit n=1 Tax=Cladophialophora carrionii TaxID=86049 RepID=A0A1C1CG49_9EURO|nr:DNA polymerase sigma subunit [Cladophialophora carrionii]